MRDMKTRVIDAIRPVLDPDVGYSIVDIGLIREVYVEEGGAVIVVLMTLTTPFCPFAGDLKAAVIKNVSALPEVNHCDVEFQLNPPWDPRTEASDDVKAELGIWD